jgi:O-antigen ligase
LIPVPSLPSAAEREAPRATVPVPTWAVALTTAILLLAGRAVHLAFPTLGLVADDRLTPAGRALWPVLALLAGLAVLRVPAARRARLDPWVALTLAVVVATPLWSVDAARSAYQSLVLVCVAVCAWFLATVVRREALVDVTTWVLGAVCVVNAAVIPFGVGRRDDAASIAFFEHKNLLGSVAAMLLVLVVARLVARDRSTTSLVLAVVAMATLALSGSRAGQVAAVVAVGTMVLVALWRRVPQLAVGAAFLGGALLVVVVSVAGGVEGLVRASGRDPDLTGRTGIWTGVAHLVRERPLQGWGFLAFWRDGPFATEGPSGFARFGLRSAHNGYLEVALGAGIVAAILVVVTLVVIGARAARRFVGAGRDMVALALVGTVVFAGVVNVAESFFPASTFTLPTLLVVALSAREAGA